ncbi:transcriptional regulator, TetR family [Nannocystis exedens]|uniref:Transcriptional regulator, TetR family n=1 Tax=Nannocystis exedens TaxID=54 RepID=A0A1I2A0P3_9BACT|nr:TetR/AcrR family transcriptional regulator [Nannocystis exedens]PCC75256.1 TetR family transcriptional regulator [Nannocystis exedens]SFE36310.1 transcriptional regulator, TetR family [Nannocystis exedens]
MARIIKKPEVRRGELLDCAQALFFERGYERTTMNDILARAGVSKGGFYHHFESKEQLLAALAARTAQATVARFDDVLAAPGLDALARLNAFFARAREIKVAEAPALRATYDSLFRPENTVLYLRIHAAVNPVIAPVLARILEQGRDEGVFDVPDPLAAAEIVLQLGTTIQGAMGRALAAVGTDDAEAAIQALEARLRFHGLAVERILGLPPGSIRFIEPDTVAAVIADGRILQR